MGLRKNSGTELNKKRQRRIDVALIFCAVDNALKSTESDEKVVDEQTPAEKEERAEAAGNDVKMSVVGPLSETADLSALDTAIAMLESDPNADTVSETGWWLGKDGKWRYEISDKDADFRPEGFVKNPKTLGDYVKHDKLFGAYPWLRDVRVEIVDSIGDNPRLAASYNEDTDTISIRNGAKDAEAVKKDLIHEIQHAVQKFEGFKGGSNPNNAAFYLLEMFYKQVKDLPEFKQIKTPEGKKRFIIRQAENNMGKAFAEVAFDAYYYDHGEVEARESANRMEMTPNQRKENPIANNGIVFDEAQFEERMIDILQDIGYTKNQIYDFYKNGDFFNDELANVSQSERSIQSRSERNYAGRRRQSQETVGENAETRRRVHGSVESGFDNATHTETGVRGLRRDNQVKFSVSPEADEDYLSAVENGDMETAQRMVDEGNEDIRYSVTISDLEDEYGVNIDTEIADLYSTKDYNNFGWARVNNILSSGENEEFKRRLQDKSKYSKTLKGEYMIPVGDYNNVKRGADNVIVFTKGSFDNPVITQVVRINLDNDTECSYVREEIINNLSKGARYDTVRNIIEKTYGKELLARYTRDGAPSLREIRQANNTGRGSTDNRGISVGEGSNTDASSKIPGIEERIKYSVSEEVTDGSDSQSFSEMIAETRANKESNAALVEKFLNERGKYIDGSSVRKLLNGIIGAHGSEAWYGNVEKKYREMFEKVYNNKGGKVDAILRQLSLRCSGEPRRLPRPLTHR